MKRLLGKLLSVGSAIALVVLMALPVFAATYSYYIPVTVSDSSGTAKAGIPILVDMGNSSMVDLDFMESSGLDTSFQESGIPRAYMVVDERLGLLLPSLSAYQTKELTYYTSYAPPQTSFGIVVGPGGSVGVSDTDPLEPGNNFEFEWDGWVDTTSGSNKYLLNKAAAVEVYVSAAGSLTANIISADSDTFYPDPHVEVTSVDGQVSDIYSDLSWASLRQAPGSNSGDTSTSEFVIRIGASSTSQQYRYLHRGVFLYDTSPLGAGVTPTSATLSFHGVTKTDGLGANPNINVYSSNPASNIALVDTDFDISRFGSTPFCDTPISYTSWNITGYNDFVLNSAGMAAINTTGVSKFGLRDATYDVPNTQPPWISNQSCTVEVRQAETTGTSQDPKLVVNYTEVTASVTATGVSSGERKVVVTATGGGTNLLTISVYDENNDLIDDDSVALTGASVPPNDNNWLINQNTVMPYMEYYKHTVDSTLIAWYQPVTMIIGTTLPDREGVAQNGTITFGGRLADSGSQTTLVDDALTQVDDYWNGYVLKVKDTTDDLAPKGEESDITNFEAGTDTLTFDALTVAVGIGDRYEIWDGQTILWGSFPDGIRVGVGSLTGFSSAESAAAGGVDPTVVGIPPLPSGAWGGAADPGLPLYPLFSQVATNLGWTAQTLYVTASVIVAVGMGVAALLMTGSILAAIVMASIGMGGGYAMGVLPLWMIMVYGLLGGTWMYVARSM